MSATNFGQNWPSYGSADSVLNGASVSAGSTSSNSNGISNSAASPNEVLDTEIDVEIAYGSTVSGGPAVVYILRQTKSGYESPSTDTPYQFNAPVAASTTCHATCVVSGSDFGAFQVAVSNPSGNSSITVTLYSRQSQGQFG